MDQLTALFDLLRRHYVDAAARGDGMLLFIR
jgi:hypothetical protein